MPKRRIERTQKATTPNEFNRILHLQVEDREDIKKEREIMQMVQDLDLSGDELERSEVPRSMYDARGIPPAPVIITAPQLNGRGHRR